LYEDRGGIEGGGIGDMNGSWLLEEDLFELLLGLSAFNKFVQELNRNA
jgi:hypothetical protein